MFNCTIPTETDSSVQIQPLKDETQEIQEKNFQDF